MAAPPPPGPIRLGPGPEFDLIRRFLASAPSGPAAGAVGVGGGEAPISSRVRVGPGDDCAIVERIALSTDLSIEDVHFRRAWLEPEEIGYRATAAALSDLAAVAARPIGILCSLACAPADAAGYAPRVVAGLHEAASELGAVLLGGDLARSPGPLALDIVVVGEAARPVLRAGARPGDALWVTGELGAAAAAVLAWQWGESPPAAARRAFARPKARVREALWLAERGLPHALIDLSDGLAGDAAHLAAAGGVRVVLDAAAIPVHPAASAVSANAEEALRLALAGGEDYELCFAAAEGAVEAVAEAFQTAFGVMLHRVGRVEQGGGAWIRHGDGRPEPLAAGGYQHFGGQAG
ncbi:MAG TPA: thiamine-phosphate kinase [Longimicrobiales bacterium]